LIFEENTRIEGEQIEIGTEKLKIGGNSFFGEFALVSFESG